MWEQLNTPGVREAVIVVVAVLLTQLVKWRQAEVANSKIAMRVLVVIVCGLGALASSWSDGRVTAVEWFGTFWPAVTGAEFSYQWLLKALGGLSGNSGNPPATGMAVQD